MLEQARLEVEKWLLAISNESPSGSVLSGDPQFEELRTEVLKLDSPLAGEANWKKIEELGITILSTQSKDLLVAAYTAHALHQQRGPGGLLVGILGLHGLLERYWEGMFPPLRRMNGRVNALRWLIDRSQLHLKNGNDEINDRSLVDVLLQATQQLSLMVREKFAEHAPSLSPVVETLQRIQLSLPEAPKNQSEAAEAKQSNEGSYPSQSTKGSPADEPSNKSRLGQQDSEPPLISDEATSAVQPTESEVPASNEAEESTHTDELAELKNWTKPWLAPISGEHPAGEDVGSTGEFDAIQLEVAKLTSLADEAVNWQLVIENADVLLKQKGKDLRVVCYLAFGQFQVHGLEGLNRGLYLLSEFVQQYWETLFPAKNRMRGRASPVRWLIEGLEIPLKELELSSKERDSLQRFAKVVQHISQVIPELFEEHAPAMRPLSERVKRMQMTMAPAKPEPAAAPSQPASTSHSSPPPATSQAVASVTQQAPVPTPTASKPGEALPESVSANSVTNPEEVNKFLTTTGQGLMRAANILRKAKASDPLAYRLLRMGAWLHIAKAPPANAQGKTVLPGLPANVRERLELMLKNQRWAPLLDESESLVQQFRFILDVHRYTSIALTGLGDEYKDASIAVKTEVAGLLQRMPELLQLQSADGAPLADQATQAWLSEAVLSPSSSVSGVSSGSVKRGTEGGISAKELIALLAAGQQKKAFEQAQEHAQQSRGVREKFSVHLALAQACMSTGKASLARTVFAGISREIHNEMISKWDPQLAIECLSGFAQSLSQVSPRSELVNRDIHAVLERIAALDPVHALTLSEQLFSGKST